MLDLAHTPGAKRNARAKYPAAVRNASFFIGSLLLGLNVELNGILKQK
jgi:hypothetical protein